MFTPQAYGRLGCDLRHDRSAFNYLPDHDRHLIVLLAASLNGGHHDAGRHRENTYGRFAGDTGCAHFLFGIKCGAASKMGDIMNARCIG